MPSFDAVSEVDMHEVTNAVDQAKRELSNRWDFKNVDVDIVLENSKLTFSAEQDFQLEQVVEVAKMALAKRKVDSRAMVEAGDSKAGKLVKKTFDLKQGIDSLTAKKMMKLVKESKIKVQAAIQGEKVRVTGKKRDDLQQVMALWKESDIEVPLQYNNFRD
ncbi:YajQ family cyclic di-GMP-binding protein [Oleiphilus sp. HI0125]|uniref:YajQ family cyclic di-GMP-binding protein n=1 Tax=Oleiphilus sp. HI0125 TaxID=1822266 RepID=UPI0007C20ACB|nr:YajQ family cyclic di-GMP-binding protein [Oleiphilus sp. HI0125]KZZ59512.1 YajQ family cyclic di-GMP-binding protein [Oleiphilus sp. HI0125]